MTRLRILSLTMALLAAAAPSWRTARGIAQGNPVPAIMPAMKLLTAARVYAEIGGGVNTGVVIANPNDRSVNVAFSGSCSAKSFTVPAKNQIAIFLTETPFNCPSPLLGIVTFRASAPVGMVALRGHTNRQSEFLITAQPVVELSEGPGAPVKSRFEKRSFQRRFDVNGA